MATCNPSTLLASGAAFQALSDKGLMLCQVQLLRDWASNSSTPSALMTDGAAFQALDDKSLSIAEAQLLCEINGSVA